MASLFHKNKIFLLIFFAAGILVSLYFLRQHKLVPIRKLPFFGTSKLKHGDTIYHCVPDFSFYNQNGSVFTKQNLKNKIYVADYFFTTCGSICPVMKKQMKRVYDSFLNDSEVVFLSHTVDPETDSVAVLKEFADRMGINHDKWFFLTGDKKQLYQLARKGYLLDAEEGTGDENDFIHTQNFALVDKDFHLRGFYDGTDSSDIDRLIREIGILKQEYAAAN